MTDTDECGCNNTECGRCFPWANAPKADRQVNIRSASYRIMDETPGHVRFGVWINGGKCGDLTVRQEESVGFREMLDRAGFNYYG